MRGRAELCIKDCYADRASGAARILKLLHPQLSPVSVGKLALWKIKISSIIWRIQAKIHHA